MASDIVHITIDGWAACGFTPIEDQKKWPPGHVAVDGRGGAKERDRATCPACKKLVADYLEQSAKEQAGHAP